MRFIAAFILLFCAPVFAEKTDANNGKEPADPERFKKFEAYQDRLDKRFQQYKKLRGEDLKKAGWIEVTRCDDGHTWSYVLEKQQDQLICEGLNSANGSEEHPCVPFTGDLDKFKAKAQAKKKTCWGGSDMST